MTMQFGTRLFALAALLPVAGSALAAPPVRTSAPVLRWSRPSVAVSLSGRYASARPLVEQVGPSGPRDVSSIVRWTVGDPAVVVVEDGILRPRGDGETVVRAQLKGSTIAMPVRVHGFAATTPRFVRDVVPVLTRLGCNQGGCHGATQGKGGFKLSLQGYDPDSDFLSITRGAAGRRVAPSRPEASLLLRKPTGAVAHKGGKLLEANSPHWQLLVDWIASGMPGPRKDDNSLSKLDIVPSTRILPVGSVQRFRVMASFSDGTTRDVTQESLFSGSNAQVANVSPDGSTQVVGKGESAVLVRYDDKVVTAT
ncbi:MAG: hypothetical protein ACKO5K_02030, partial [Armatimonadota bacterium]